MLILDLPLAPFKTDTSCNNSPELNIEHYDLTFLLALAQSGVFVAVFTDKVKISFCQAFANL